MEWDTHYEGVLTFGNFGGGLFEYMPFSGNWLENELAAGLHNFFGDRDSPVNDTI